MLSSLRSSCFLNVQRVSLFIIVITSLGAVRGERKERTLSIVRLLRKAAQTQKERATSKRIGQIERQRAATAIPSRDSTLRVPGRRRRERPTPDAGAGSAAAPSSWASRRWTRRQPRRSLPCGPQFSCPVRLAQRIKVTTRSTAQSTRALTISKADSALRREKRRAVGGSHGTKRTTEPEQYGHRLTRDSFVERATRSWHRPRTAARRTLAVKRRRMRKERRPKARTKRDGWRGEAPASHLAAEVCLHSTPPVPKSQAPSTRRKARTENLHSRDLRDRSPRAVHLGRCHHLRQFVFISAPWPASLFFDFYGVIFSSFF